jgi:thaumarchaeosortase
VKKTAGDKTLHRFTKVTSYLRLIVQPRNLIAVVLLLPIFILIIGAPYSFARISGWQLGRGSFLFLAFIVLWEWFDSRKGLPTKVTRGRLILAVAIVLAVSAYYAARVVSPQLWGSRGALDLTKFEPPGAGTDPGIDGFPLAVDYVAYIVLAFLETLLLLGVRGFKQITTPVVYSVGTTGLVLLDAFSPYDSLAFMQNSVGVIWQLVLVVLKAIGVRVVSSPTMLSPPPAVELIRNSLLVNGIKGPTTIIIYWPSSGLVSVLIFSIVIAVIMIKMDLPLNRKIAFAAIGALGTFMVNLIRVSMIVSYAMFISLQIETVVVVGEILFLIWLVIYLALIIRYEKRYCSQRSAFGGHD